jgi:hypothetical protein
VLILIFSSINTKNYFAVIPPSISIFAPVIHFALSEQINKIALEISEGSPILCRGNDDSKVFFAFSSLRYGSRKGVLIVDGTIQLHLIPYCPYSTATCLVNEIIPPLVSP